MLWRGPFGQGAASGAMGALVASHNKGGQYLRARTTPTNPSSLFQEEVRNATRTLAPRWSSTLTQDQRDAWAVYAANVTMTNRLGDQIKLSGIAQYIRSNTSRIQAGLDIIDDAPVIWDIGDIGPGVSITLQVNPSAPAAGTVTLIGGASSQTWMNSSSPDAAMLIYLSRPQNQGKNFFKGPYRLATIITGDITTNTVTFTSPFISGDADSKSFAAIRVTREDGRLSGQQFLNAS